MADKIISVVIPLYNSLPYFERTIESLESQTLDASLFEVIIVDDGSTDGSERLADQAAARNPNTFRVVHEPPSGGPAHPRNIGISEATGDYVFFLDSDDFLGKEALRRMADHAREWNSDILLVKLIGENGRKAPRSMFRDDQPNVDIWKSRAVNTLSPLRLFRTDLIRDNALSFPEWTKHREDHVFVAQALFLAKTVSVASDYDYCHIVTRAGDENLTSETFMDFDIDCEITRIIFGAMDAAAPDAAAGRTRVIPRIAKSSWFAAAYAASRNPDAATRNEMYGILGELLTPHIDEKSTKEQLSAGLGDFASLILKGEYDLATECIGMLKTTPTSEFAGVDLDNGTVAIEHGKLVLTSPQGNVRIDCTRQIPVTSTISDFHAGWNLRFSCSLDQSGFWEPDAQILLVLVPKHADGEFAIKARHVRRAGDGELRFDFTLNALTCWKLTRVENGIWDCFMRVEQGGVQRQVRFGPTMTYECRTRLKESNTVWRMPGKRLKAHFTPIGNLSLRTRHNTAK